MKKEGCHDLGNILSFFHIPITSAVNVQLESQYTVFAFMWKIYVINMRIIFSFQIFGINSNIWSKSGQQHGDGVTWGKARIGLPSSLKGKTFQVRYSNQVF